MILAFSEAEYLMRRPPIPMRSARRKIVEGLNPKTERRRDAGVPTFGQIADHVCETLSAEFRNEKHQRQWRSTLASYAAPLRAKPVDTIVTE